MTRNYATPTAEWDHVTRAVAEYIEHGDFPAEDDRLYPWGPAAVKI